MTKNGLRKETAFLAVAMMILSAAVTVMIIEADSSADTTANSWTDDKSYYNTEWYDSGKSQYTISSAEQLAGLAYLVNDGNGGSSFAGVTFILDADLDLSAHYWTPIGNNSKQFKGTFDGNGHTITGLKIVNPNNVYSGLFGNVGAGATVKDLNVVVDIKVTVSTEDSPKVGDQAYIGGIAGCNEGTVSGCSVNGSIECSSRINNFVGGLVGYNNGSITNCYNTGNVSVSGDIHNHAGGLVGINEGSISNCYNTGNVSVPSGVDNYVGGLVGYNLGSSISNCYRLDSNINVIGRDDSGVVSESCHSFRYGTGDGDCILNDSVTVYNTTTKSLCDALNAGRSSNSEWYEWVTLPELFSPCMNVPKPADPEIPADPEPSYNVRIVPDSGCYVYCSKGTSFTMTNADSCRFTIHLDEGYKILTAPYAKNAVISGSGDTYTISGVSGDVTVRIYTQHPFEDPSSDDSGGYRTILVAVAACAAFALMVTGMFAVMGRK